MSSNKRAREELEKRYGKECFIEKLHLRKDKERYKGKAQKKKMEQLSYHHIVMKKDGGESTVENGALLKNGNHIWFHNQSESAQGYMNAIFQEYKRQVDKCTEYFNEECEVIFADDVETPYTVTATEFAIDEKNRGEYNRAKEKEELRKLSEEYVDR